MFVLYEHKLRQALADEGNDLVAFDPMKVDADELHSFIDDALDLGVIGRDDSAVGISIYPLALDEPEPLIAVYANASTVVGGSVFLETSPSDEEGTVNTVRRIVENADAIYVKEARDHHALDRLAVRLNEYADEGREWDHAEICNELVQALQDTGRDVRFWTADA